MGTCGGIDPRNTSLTLEDFMNLFAAAAELLPTDAEINTLLKGNIDDENVSPMLRGGMFSFVTPSGREYNLARWADTLFPPVVVEDEVNSEDDATIPQIEDSGRPGSAARLAAYRSFYESNPNGSPNEGVLSDDEMATRYIHNVAFSTAKHAAPLKEGLALMATWAMEDAAAEEGE